MTSRPDHEDEPWFPTRTGDVVLLEGNVMATFKEAATNSLDYLILVYMQPSAAANYRAVQRAIQQTCVTVCNTQGWGIPFPQLVLHAGEGERVPGTAE